MLARINVGFIIATALGFILFFIVVITILFYIQHKKTAKIVKLKGANNLGSSDGRYFQRLFTPILISKYFQNDNDKQKKLTFMDRLFDFAPYLLVLGASLAVTVSFFVSQSHRFYKPIVLSGEELQALKYARHNWVEDVGALRPDIKNYLYQARDKTFILVQNQDDQDWVMGGSMGKIGSESLLHWRHFVEHYRLKSKICSWKALKKCREGISKNIFVILPGRWDIGQMDELSKKGAAIWVYGPPRQLWEESSEGNFEWRGIRFTLSDEHAERSIALIGDQPLTLGFNPGEVIRFSQLAKGYSVDFENPDGVSFDMQMNSNKNRSRLIGIAQEKSRVVYSDFPPHYVDNTMGASQREVEAVVASYLRFLLRSSFETIASWPEGSLSATLIAVDINSHKNKIDPVLEILNEASVKATFYLLSNWAEKFSGYIPKLSLLGEVACIADNQSALVEDTMQTQLERLMLCQKILKSLGAQGTRSIHPPFEKLSSESIDAVINTGFSRVFGFSPKELLSPVTFTAKSLNRSIFFVKRMSSGSYELFGDTHLSYVDAARVVSQEQSFAYFIRGVYSYTHNTSQDSVEAHKVLKYAIDSAKSQNSYIATLDELAAWWSVRTSLIMGAKPTGEQLKIYKPQIIKLNESGKIERREYNNI